MQTESPFTILQNKVEKHIMNFGTTVLVVTCAIITILSVGAALYAKFCMRSLDKSSFSEDLSENYDGKVQGQLSERESLILRRADANAASAEARQLVLRARRDGKI